MYVRSKKKDHVWKESHQYWLIRIIEGDNGLFIAMPSRKTAVGGYRDIAHPINPEVRAMFEEAIFEAYKNAEDEASEEE